MALTATRISRDNASAAQPSNHAQLKSLSKKQVCSLAIARLITKQTGEEGKPNNTPGTKRVSQKRQKSCVALAQVSRTQMGMGQN